MNLTVNGEATALAEGTTVDDLVAEVAGTRRGVAVSVDRAVVPRSAWAQTSLKEGEAVEVLVAAAGG